MTDILQRKLSLSDDAMESPVGEETVILHLGNGTYYGLDAVGTRVWALLKDGVAPADMCRRLSEEYDVPLETVEADARTFLGDLEAQGMLVEE